MGYLRICVHYRLSDCIANIRCPTLVTQAESDPVAAYAGWLYDALTGPKTFIRFTAAEGAPATIARLPRARSISSAPTTGSTACWQIAGAGSAGRRFLASRSEAIDGPLRLARAL